MFTKLRSAATQWTTAVPAAAFLVLVLTWHRDLPGWVVALVSCFLAGAVLAAVHHAEVVAHRVGEPYGSLVLAVAVTVIEVALIVTLMADGGDKAATLARDTVFAAVMITCNGIFGLSLLVAALKYRVAVFNAEGTGAALATIGTLAALSLVLPTFTTSSPGPQFAPAQLAFAAAASFLLYGLFVATLTVRHRDYFLPVTPEGKVLDEEDHAAPPTVRATVTSLMLLGVALIAVVGLAKGVSPTIESAVDSAGLPASVVGVVIALLVLLPETIAAIRSAVRNRVQTSLNLALGSALASIGLTIPAVAIASIWLTGPLVLGLDSSHLVLLVLTLIVGTLTVMPRRATPLQGGVHLAILAAYVVLAINP
ncbi:MULTISPECIES: ionic transporter y4hA [unclassified Streptomyces]|uniref:calcium:proton antiporter n=1 Tax=Streptomycetaceae TaxID=2062 RepID=UPI002E771A2D|nr:MULTISPECIES: ionic transporter y4hA [unclassified Streptomyces]MED7952741.1 ionic transporter y4hA [Streptomyces sp. BE303]MEE1825666.1 ionic transporter y4hA [Streptomyces sp. BE20]